MNPHLQTPLLVCLPLMVLLLSSSPLKLKAEVVTPIARPHCKDKCGNVSIPFPWGIGAGCFLDDWFEIDCKPSPLSNGFAKPLLSKFDVEIVQIQVVGQDNDGISIEDQQLIVRMRPMNACTTDTQPLSSIDLRGGPYNFSAEENVFVMEGCSGSAVLVNKSNTTVAVCATICHNNNTEMESNNCFGVKCCQSPLPDGLQFYNLEFNRQSSSELGQNCLLAALIKSDSLEDYVGKLSTSDPSGTAIVSFSWSWISKTPPDFNPHALCEHDAYYNSTICSCNDDSVGNNPYVSGGCQVADECKGCLPGHCSSWNNSYHCYYHEPPRFKLAAILGFSIGLGVIALVISCYGLYRFIKRRRQTKRRAKYFKRNGGLLLEQHLCWNSVGNSRFTTLKQRLSPTKF